MVDNGTDTKGANEPYARQGGTNPANEIPKKMRRDDKAYIDSKLGMFKKDHAMSVHQRHMDLVRKNALDNSVKRKLP
jgi:hypothetical protein